MKKLLMTAVLPVVLVISAGAQKLSASVVPAAVKSAFEKKYPGVTASWEKENNNYEAGFKYNKRFMSVLLQADGKIVETETVINKSGLPPAALTYINAHFSGKKIKEASKIVSANGTVTYEAEVNGSDQIFDTAGNFLREQKD